MYTTPALYSVRQTNNFYVPNGEENVFWEQLETPYYQNGPEPAMVVDQSKDPIERQLACWCRDARECFINHVNTTKSFSQINDWNAYFSSEMLKGKSSITTFFVKQMFQIYKGMHLDCQLVVHEFSELLPNENTIKHVFQIVTVGDRKFIIDLSIRQFINGGLRLKDKEVAVFDALLKNGFVELTEKSLQIYLCFLKNRSLFEQHHTYFKDEWALSSKYCPNTLDLSKSTYDGKIQKKY